MKLQLCFSVAILLAYSYQAALAQERRGPGCPLISVSQLEPASTGQTHIYKASIQNGDPSVTPKFNWTVLDRKITSGQGTSEVSVAVEGNNSFTVSVEVTGYAANCQNKASYSLIVYRVPSRKFDDYRNLKFSEERLRLDQFAIALHNEPGSKGYIVVYDATDKRKPAARERGERAKNYLVKERGFPKARIVVVNGGRRYKRSVELFITPAGAVPPTVIPTRSPQ
jgi:hypothetical protein